MTGNIVANEKNPFRLGRIQPMKFMAPAVLALMSLVASSHAEKPDFVRDRILVKAKNHVSEKKVAEIFAENRAKVKDTIGRLKVHVLHVPEYRMAKVLNELQNDPSIEFAEPDWIVPAATVPNDPWYPYQWHLEKIQAPTAWDVTTGSSAVTIAILDTGVDGSHPDLAPLMVPGWNFYDNSSDTWDVNGHGTVVAGQAGAVGNNATGVTGVTWNCRLMPVRIADQSGMGVASLIANGLVYAADHGCRVANLSYAINGIATISDAAAYFVSRGGIVTAGAGNNGATFTNPDDPNILLVSATDQNDLLATFSCRGTPIDLSAPGVDIKSTGLNGGYVAGTGTSASAPIVAGVAALMFSVNPQLSAQQVCDLLKQSTDDLGTPGWDAQFGWGRLNAAKAVAAASGASVPAPDTVAPTPTILAPVAGGTVTGSVSVNVGGSDNVAVTRIEWYLDGSLKGTSTSSSASFNWDTKTAGNGPHTIAAKAFDAAGNSGSVSAAVTVNNPVLDTTAPKVSILSPVSGATVADVISVNVSGSDNVGVTKIEWYLDGVLAGSNNSGTASFSWDTLMTSNGSHVITAKAYDLAGNVGTTSRNVTIDNVVPVTNPTPADLIAPTVRIASPASGTTLSGKNSVKIGVTASDNVAVTRVELFVDGKLLQSSTSSTPTFTWSTGKVAKGNHSLQAFAYDAGGNRGASSVVTVTK